MKPNSLRTQQCTKNHPNNHHTPGSTTNTPHNREHQQVLHEKHSDCQNNHPRAKTPGLSVDTSTIEHTVSSTNENSNGHPQLGGKLLRKEVIQPHLPVRLPCYDLVPIASPTFDHSPQKTGWAMSFGCYQLS